MSGATSGSIRVAVLTPRLPPCADMGGIATAHFNLASALGTAGYRVKAFAYQDMQDSESESEARRIPSTALASAIRASCRAAFAVLNPSRQSYQLAETLIGALAGRRMAGALAHFRPEIVIAPDKGCPLAFMATPPGARVIWITHNKP